VGLITVVLLIQAAALVTLALASRRLAARARTLEDEVRSQLGPSLARLGRVAENAEEISDRLVHGLPHLEAAVADAAENIQRANRIFEGSKACCRCPSGRSPAGSRCFGALPRRGRHRSRVASAVRDGGRPRSSVARPDEPGSNGGRSLTASSARVYIPASPPEKPVGS
jgi:ABC-type transporter Mla subunit MlaD